MYDDPTHSAAVVIVWVSTYTCLAFTLVVVDLFARHFVFHTFISFEPLALSVSPCVSVFYLRIWLVPVPPSHFSRFRFHFNKS